MCKKKEILDQNKNEMDQLKKDIASYISSIEANRLLLRETLTIIRKYYAGFICTFCSGYSAPPLRIDENESPIDKKFLFYSVKSFREYTEMTNAIMTLHQQTFGLKRIISAIDKQGVESTYSGDLVDESRIQTGLDLIAQCIKDGDTIEKINEKKCGQIIEASNPWFKCELLESFEKLMEFALQVIKNTFAEKANIPEKIVQPLSIIEFHKQRPDVEFDFGFSGLAFTEEDFFDLTNNKLEYKKFIGSSALLSSMAAVFIAMLL